jgi:TRAP-type uncharacterized transport system fused permease subunit
MWADWYLTGNMMPAALILDWYGPAAGGRHGRRADRLGGVPRHLHHAAQCGRRAAGALGDLAVALYLIFFRAQLQMRAGMPMATTGDMWAAIAGIVLILELTRRLAGLALVIIAGIFILYAFRRALAAGRAGASRLRRQALLHLHLHRQRHPRADRRRSRPPTSSCSSPSRPSCRPAGWANTSSTSPSPPPAQARGGPAKVAVFGSGLMGMINGTSAGNVVSTGSLTIPLMKKVGYKPQTAAAVEAAASSGGQILPPIMGAGAFIMAEITGIAYTDIVIAAIIPAVLYFASVYFMVDLAALKFGMKGLPREELPEFRKLARQAFLFIPIIILIGRCSGYSVIRAGTLAMARRRWSAG